MGRDRRVERVFDPPAFTYRVVLKTGDQVRVDFVDEGALRREVERRGVLWTEGGRATRR
jgi:hypothetical protein